MWVLLIVFLALPSHDTVLDRFETQQACLMERDRIGFEMAASYEYDHDFDIVCTFQARLI
jgi:hypothetical protein